MATLTASKVTDLTKPGRYGDGGGLYLNIAPGGTKNWVQRVTIGGKRTDRGLGGCPKVSLTKARKLADANRVTIRKGINPWEGGTKPILESQAAPAETPSFREAARRFYETKADGMAAGTAKRWLRRLEIHTFAALGDSPVDEITRDGLAEILAPIKKRNFETFRKVKQATSKVLTWCVAKRYIDHNLADAALDVLLPDVRRQVKHRESLPHADVANAIVKIRNSEGKRAARLAFEFLILTAARSIEVREATWDEVNTEARTWTIGAARMKGGRDHVVPLSEQALAVLAQARFLSQDDDGWPWTMPKDGLIFPHPTTMRRLSENIFSDRIRKSKLGCDAHGFRSSFRDWATETIASSYEVIELCLAHRVGTAVTAAYFRSDLLEQRRELMQSWADHAAPTDSPF